MVHGGGRRERWRHPDQRPQESGCSRSRLPQFLSRALKPVPKFGVSLTERDRRVLDSALLFLQILANLRLVIQIEGNRPIDLRRFEQGEALVDRLRRIPAFEEVHDGIERDPRTRDVISAVPFLYVLAVHWPL